MLLRTGHAHLERLIELPAIQFHRLITVEFAILSRKAFRHRFQIRESLFIGQAPQGRSFGYFQQGAVACLSLKKVDTFGHKEKYQ